MIFNYVAINGEKSYQMRVTESEETAPKKVLVGFSVPKRISILKNRFVFNDPYRTMQAFLNWLHKNDSDLLHENYLMSWNQIENSVLAKSER